MSRLKRKAFLKSLRDDKWGLPTINVAIVIFGGFFVFYTLLGFEYAIALYGLGVGVFLAIISLFAKNTMEWYTNAAIDFHLWTFVILMIILTALILFLPRKAK